MQVRVGVEVERLLHRCYCVNPRRHVDTWAGHYWVGVIERADKPFIELLIPKSLVEIRSMFIYSMCLNLSL